MPSEFPSAGDPVKFCSLLLASSCTACVLRFCAVSVDAVPGGSVLGVEVLWVATSEVAPPASTK